MDNRKILRTIRVSGGPTFKPGQEEQLAAAVGQSELDTLVAGEALSGSWSSSVSDEQPPIKEAADKKTEVSRQKKEVRKEKPENGKQNIEGRRQNKKTASGE